MFFKWGFRANLKIHQSVEDSVELKTKDSKDTEKFSDFIKDLSIIDASKKLWLHPLLFNGTLQTIYYGSVDASSQFKIFYGREIFTYKDGGICSLDYVIPPEPKEKFDQLYKENLPEGWPRLNARSRFFSPEELKERTSHDQDLESTKPICVVLHGLGGGSHEPLIRNLAENLTTGKNKDNWDVVVINSRGCCRTKLVSEVVFSALSTEDIHEVLIELKKRYPTRPIYAVGFSFGACILSRFIAEQGESGENLVKASCLIGCPWDMVDSSDHILKSWSGAYLFSPSVTSFMVKLVKNNYKELSTHNPKLYNKESLERAKKFTHPLEMADEFTCHEVGLSTGLEYYQKGSPQNVMQNIKTPTLILNSTDDPTVGVKLPIEKVNGNPYLCMVETDLGGHLGYVQRNGEFWCSELVEEFFYNFENTFA
ncbi:medium-chain fatty acid ethyl ester synthase/esterase 1 [[Candida] anglica]|uniref:Medium-chain fatty acid ethyl ester synthase/esterase 1 n=1 Tax=[Candida] anglica TaxID=148631 RepID=A0ABP0E7K4_9ASCO